MELAIETHWVFLIDYNVNVLLVQNTYTLMII